MKFYYCEHCGNVITFVKDKGVPVTCCGQKMTLINENTSDGAFEKHVPVSHIDSNKISVKIGSVEHPMISEHYIEFIAVETNKGSQIKYLSPFETPEAEFLLAKNEKLIATYAYCNLHGLWKA